MQDLESNVDYVLIDEERLAKRAKELAAEITADYADADDLLLVAILKGAYMFLTDFSRELKRPHAVDFMAISSYGGGTESRAVRVILDLNIDITNRHVLLVEDIVDSGKTLSTVLKMLESREPASLKIVTLLDKPSRRNVNVPVDYVGFEIPDEFVVGYGLDFDELYRNLPYIAVLKPEVFAHLLEE